MVVIFLSSVLSKFVIFYFIQFGSLFPLKGLSIEHGSSGNGAVTMIVSEHQAKRDTISSGYGASAFLPFIATHR